MVYISGRVVDGTSTSCFGEFKPVLGETTFIGHNACYCLWRALPVVGFQLICLFICRNRTHLRILTSTSDIQPAIYCTSPSIIYIPHCVLDRNCALGVLRFLHYYSGAVALYITQNRVGAADSFTFWHLRFTLVTAAWVFWDHSRIWTRNENLISPI